VESTYEERDGRSTHQRPGERRLREQLRRSARARRHRARSEDPRPYDDDWGWWIEDRIARLENGQTWLIRIAIGALVAEIIRIITVTTGLGP
jgi:hypothetical protein